MAGWVGGLTVALLGVAAPKRAVLAPQTPLEFAAFSCNCVFAWRWKAASERSSVQEHLMPCFAYNFGRSRGRAGDVGNVTLALEGRL